VLAVVAQEPVTIFAESRACPTNDLGRVIRSGCG
jgi:hypothetical protein